MDSHKCGCGFATDNINLFNLLFSFQETQKVGFLSMHILKYLPHFLLRLVEIFMQLLVASLFSKPFLILISRCYQALELLKLCLQNKYNVGTGLEHVWLCPPLPRNLSFLGFLDMG